MGMKIGIVAADGARARYITAEVTDDIDLEGNPRLIEHDNVVNPLGVMPARDTFRDRPSRKPSGGGPHGAGPLSAASCVAWWRPCRGSRANRASFGWSLPLARVCSAYCAPSSMRCGPGGSIWSSSLSTCRRSHYPRCVTRWCNVVCCRSRSCPEAPCFAPAVSRSKAEPPSEEGGCLRVSGRAETRRQQRAGSQPSSCPRGLT
jgi:hypothetical protein